MNAYAPLHRLVALFALCFAVCVAAPALAQDTAPLEEALTGAQDDFDMIELDAADEKLSDAIKYAKKKGITSGPELANVYVMRGVIRFSADQDADKTEADFIAAIEADPSVQIGKFYVTPELSEIMARARKKAKVKKPDPDPKTDPDPKDDPDTKTEPVQTDSFVHEVIKKAPAGKPLTIEAFVPANMPAYSMAVYHKRFGETEFTRTDMEPTDATRFAGDIPPNQVRTSELEYYVEVYDRGSNVLASSGSADSPHAVLLTGSAGLGDPDPDPDPDPEKPGEVGDGVVYFGITGGSGFGFLPGGVPTANPTREVSPGLAPAFGHAGLDLGWVINPSMRLGIYTRFQFSPQQDFTQIETDGGGFPTTDEECFGLGLPGDCALGLRYRYYFSEDPSALRFFSNVGLGVGRVRNWVQLKEFATLSSTGSIPVENPNCTGKEIFTDPQSNSDFCYLRDTVRTGWFHAGLGGGLSIPLAPHVEFVGEAFLMLLAGDQTSFNLDANLGLHFWF
jgi:hypothetical protein